MCHNPLNDQKYNLKLRINQGTKWEANFSVHDSDLSSQDCVFVLL